jgi:transcriptional regulator with XRE-family HTH domain
LTNLKFWRLSNNLRQTEAARLCGLGLSAYSLIEAGRLLPSRTQAERLGHLFGARASKMLERVPTSIP